jgi:hypothetical protein
MQLHAAPLPMLKLVAHPREIFRFRVNCTSRGCPWSCPAIDADDAWMVLTEHLRNEHHPLAVHQES